MRDLPLKDRNYLDLVPGFAEATRGQAGGNIEGYGPYSTRGNMSLNSLGQRGQNNNFLIDGIDNNDTWLRGTVLAPSIEATEAVSLSLTYLPADVGHAAGASVNVQTRGGSNQVHGSVSDYLQNSLPNARNFFDGAKKPGLVQNLFGGSIGGPLRRNEWFYFASAESSRQRRGLTVLSTVPTAAQKAGDFGATPLYDPSTINEIRPVEFARQPFAGSRIPPARVPVQASLLTALYPDPNLRGPVSNFRFTPVLVRDSDRFDARSDKSVSGRGTVFIRLSYQRQATRSPSALPVPGLAASDPAQHADAADTRLTAWGGAVSHTARIGPSLVHELRVGLSRMDLTGRAMDSGSDAAAALGIAGLGADGMPLARPTGYSQLGASGPLPLAIRTTNYQVENALSRSSGRHTWKFGAQAIRRHANGSASEWTSRGTFLFTPDYTSQPGVDHTGNSIASLLTGYPSEVRRDIQYQPFQLRGWEWAAYALDSFRLGSRVTVQAGVRYSPFPPVTEARDRMVNFNYSRTTPALDQFAGQGGVNRYAGPGFKQWAIAPRISFAVDLFGSATTVLRGAFSQTYDTGSYVAQGRLARNPPFATRQDIFAGSLQLGLSLADGLPAPERGALVDAPSLNRVRGSIYAIEPVDYTPYSDQWGLSLQQFLRSGLILEIGGMGSMGMHLHSEMNINQPYPAPSPYAWRRYPHEPYVSRVEYLGFSGGSTYYGGQVRLSGQLAPRLRLQASYRYAKSLDDSTAPGTHQESRPSAPQYIYDQRGVRSPSPFDVTQRFTLLALCELPFRSRRLPAAALSGWSASAVVTVQGGFPFTPELAVNGLNNGGIWLPNRVGNGSLPEDQRTHLRWFNTSLDRSDPDRAFETPQLYQYGNSGFNILRGAGLADVSAGLARSFPLARGLRLRTRLEAYNLLNRTNFALPNRVLGVVSSGAISRTTTPARQLQFVARLEW